MKKVQLLRVEMADGSRLDVMAESLDGAHPTALLIRKVDMVHGNDVIGIEPCMSNEVRIK